MTSADDHLRRDLIQRLLAAVDQLRSDVARVEMWAMAVATFAQPVPDYPLDHHRLPRNSGNTDWPE